MKIISERDCYAQVKDLKYLIHSDIPNEIKLLVSELISKNKINDYIKIENETIKYYILNNDDILYFNELFMISYDKLNELYKKINKTFFYTNNEITEYKLNEKIKYIKEQIKDMIDYKSKKTKCNFPNILNPCTIFNSKDNQIHYGYSLDYDKVLFQSTFGTKLYYSDNKDFYDETFKSLIGNDTGYIASNIIIDDRCYLEMKSLQLKK